jgi:hypothetical protein
MKEENALDDFLHHILQEETKERAERSMIFWDSLSSNERMIQQKMLDPYYNRAVATPRRGRY